ASDIRRDKAVQTADNNRGGGMTPDTSMEELVNMLADTEIAVGEKIASMERTTANADQRIADLEQDLKVMKAHRTMIAEPFVTKIAEDKRRIDEIKAQILDEWDPETMKKTLKFDAGTLKFRTTQSLEIQPCELQHVFERVIQSLPNSENVTKERCWDEFSIAWSIVREEED
ncbi:MAG: hypothetical protein U9Q87_18175, partial [Pseudomonadota bacterium]|nr:hypothetical protein [Pseudomonadota bacterium]